MIITLKNLQQQTFKVEFDTEKTVLELKEKIFNERGSEYSVERQKLIYAGVILDDVRTISSYNVDENKFVVIMLKRDVGALPKLEVTNTSTSQSVENKSQATKKNGSKETETITTNVENIGGNAAASVASAAAPAAENVLTQTTAPAAITEGQQSSAASHLLMGEEYQRSVESIVEMGYRREIVERAMAASYNNPERAVEYLISGIPETDNLFNVNESVPSSQEAVSNEPTQSADPFAFLRNQPQFMQMRSLVYQNPDLLQAVLHQIGQTNPALLQLISENQDAFLNMINQPLDSNVESNSRLSSNTARTISESQNIVRNLTENLQTTDSGNRSSSNSGEQRTLTEEVGRNNEQLRTTRGVISPPETVATVRLTPQDKDAIERLKALGFPEALVLQAYFACEKDEQLAANFLISIGFDD